MRLIPKARSGTSPWSKPNTAWAMNTSKGSPIPLRARLREAKKQDLILDSKILLGTAATPQDGSEMIVWGGYNGSQLNTDGRYNPSTDSWTATSTTNAPSARQSHTAVWTGSEMIIWGGYFFDGSSHYFNTGGRYDPTTDSWTGNQHYQRADWPRISHGGLGRQ